MHVSLQACLTVMRSHAFVTGRVGDEAHVLARTSPRWSEGPLLAVMISHVLFRAKSNSDWVLACVQPFGRGHPYGQVSPLSYSPSLAVEAAAYKAQSAL